MYFNSLNQDSLQRIRNIENGFKNSPIYAAYEIRNFCYNMQGGVQALEVSKNGQKVNLFLFYPDLHGKIESIAIYGQELLGHYNAMKNSMMCFGMRISSISLESGVSDYVDVYLDY